MDRSQASEKDRVEQARTFPPSVDHDSLTSGVLRFLNLLDAEGLLDEPQALRAYLVEVRGNPARLALALAAPFLRLDV